MIEDFTEDLKTYFIDDNDIKITQDKDKIYLLLDLPNTDNYESYMEELELFFDSSIYDVEHFDIDGDYEGEIEITVL